MRFVAQVLGLAGESGCIGTTATARYLKRRGVVVHGSFARVLEIVGAALGILDQDGTLLLIVAAASHRIVAILACARDKGHGRGTG